MAKVTEVKTSEVIGVGDEMILDQLYLDGGSKIATAWIWANARNLFDKLPVSISVLSYVASYYSRGLIPVGEKFKDEHGLEYTIEDALRMVPEFKQPMEAVSGATRGPKGPFLDGVMALLFELIKFWFSKDKPKESTK